MPKSETRGSLKKLRVGNEVTFWKRDNNLVWASLYTSMCSSSHRLDVVSVIVPISSTKKLVHIKARNARLIKIFTPTYFVFLEDDLLILTTKGTRNLF